MGSLKRRQTAKNTLSLIEIYSGELRQNSEWLSPMSTSQSKYTAEFYLERAEEMRSLADQMSNPDARQKMIGVAESYERLAKCAADKTALMARIKLPEPQAE